LHFQKKEDQQSADIAQLYLLNSISYISDDIVKKQRDITQFLTGNK